MPIVALSLVITIALDLTYLQTLNANSNSLISFFVGFIFVTNFSLFLLNILSSFLAEEKNYQKLNIGIGFVISF